MKSYNIEYKEKYNSPYWQTTLSDCKHNIVYRNSFGYEGLNYDQFVAELKEICDPPEDELTNETVRANFGTDISDECCEKIIEYYNYRKNLFEEILNKINEVPNVGYSVTLEFSIPSEFNSFSLNDNNYHKKSGQVYAVIRVTKVFKN